MANPHRLTRWVLALLLLASPSLALTQAPRADTLQRAQALHEQRRYAEVRALLEPYARAHPKDAAAAFQLGVAYSDDGQHDPAIHWLERAISLDGNVSRYHAELAGAYGQKAMKSNVARQAMLAPKIRGSLERAVQLDPTSIDARMGLIQFYAVAPGMMGGSTAKAEAQVAEIRRLNPYRGALASGYLRMQEKNRSAAEAEYRTALKQYPDSAALYTSLGGLYAADKRWDEAFALIDAWLTRRPDDMSAQYQLGRAGALSGQQLDRAEKALRTYLAHEPTREQPPLATARWRLGMVLEKQGRGDLAKEEYRAALKLDPKHKEAAAALRRLGG
jgi:tetratricopeptide (TPR) repeat protein